MQVIQLAIGWTALGFVGLVGMMLVLLIVLGAAGKRGIDLSHLVSEPTGEASISRFQLLVFTFVIALSVFYVTITSDTAGLPEIPTGVLTLLGISASSYAVGKGLQTHRDTTMKQLEKEAAVGGGVAAPADAYPSSKLPAKVGGSEEKKE
jgi:uncharacterized BrkB/YihY/UPF0761 family membrane protein